VNNDHLVSDQLFKRLVESMVSCAMGREVKGYVARTDKYVNVEFFPPHYLADNQKRKIEAELRELLPNRFVKVLSNSIIPEVNELLWPSPKVQFQIKKALPVCSKCGSLVASH